MADYNQLRHCRVDHLLGVDGLADPETIPTWMLSEEGRNRVKQRHTIHCMRDAGDSEGGEGSGQSAGEPPTGGVRGGSDLTS